MKVLIHLIIRMMTILKLHVIIAEFLYVIFQSSWKLVILHYKCSAIIVILCGFLKCKCEEYKKTRLWTFKLYYCACDQRMWISLRTSLFVQYKEGHIVCILAHFRVECNKGLSRNFSSSISFPHTENLGNFVYWTTELILSL